MKLRASTCLATFAICALAAACGSPGAAKPTTTQASPSHPTSPPAPEYYVSLGDSYAAGYQPTGAHSGHTDTNGFAYQVPGLAVAKGWHLKLVNFGCGGATTSSILDSDGCQQLGPGASPYPSQTQAQAADSFLRAHKSQIALITISIGGNDVTACTAASNPISCVETAVKEIQSHLKTLLAGVRAAVGPTALIVGTTYPDVILGLYTSTNKSLRNLANLSVLAFKDFINPSLQKTYAAAGAKFVDVTAATGAYGSMKAMTTLAPYGKIPVPVAEVCKLTFFCQYDDIHPRTPGYTIIANLVVGELPTHS